MVGNVWEWLTEQVECYGDDVHNGYCLGTANDIDDDILGWGYCDDDDGATNGWACDYTTGLPMTIDSYEYTTSNIQILDGTELGDYYSRIDAFDFGTSVFGITSVLDSGYDAGFNDDYFYRQYSTSSDIRAAFAGGSWDDGTDAGRFALGLLGTPSSTSYGSGFRCVLAVPAD